MLTLILWAALAVQALAALFALACGVMVGASLFPCLWESSPPHGMAKPIKER
jgi:hypothetical protein